MLGKPVFSTVLILMFLLTAVALVKANPIYPGELLMTREDMVITISKVGGKMWAEVNGAYNFSVFMPPAHSGGMYYPVPSDAESVAVKIDETPLNWIYSGKYYPTVVGDFPFIGWGISPVPNVFSIKTHYEHPVHMINESCTLLYALGTGKYLAYPKFCDVYITVYISKDIAPTGDDIDVHLVTEEGVMEPANYVMTSADGMWNVTYVELQTWGTKDFLLTIKRVPGDVNSDGTVDMQDISLLADAFLSYPGHPLWNPSADINKDNSVDMLDISIAIDYFMQS